MKLDSFIFKTQCENIEDTLKKYSNHFDFSNLPKDHPLFNDDHKNELRRFKIETKMESRITRFVGCRAKAYCYEQVCIESNQDVEMKRLKGFLIIFFFTFCLLYLS